MQTACSLAVLVLRAPSCTAVAQPLSAKCDNVNCTLSVLHKKLMYLVGPVLQVPVSFRCQAQHVSLTTLLAKSTVMLQQPLVESRIAERVTQDISSSILWTSPYCLPSPKAKRHLSIQSISSQVRSPAFMDNPEKQSISLLAEWLRANVFGGRSASVKRLQLTVAPRRSRACWTPVPSPLAWPAQLSLPGCLQVNVHALHRTCMASQRLHRGNGYSKP